MSSAAMNLLLLLSALLSALTGIGGSVRAPEPAQAVAVAAVGRIAASVAPARAAARPANTPPALTAVLAAAPVAPLAFRAVPRWIDRRRE